MRLLFGLCIIFRCFPLTASPPFLVLGCRFRLASGGTFNALIKCACKYVGPLLDHHLPVKHAKIGKGTPLPSTSKLWKKFRAPVKVYLESIAQLLSQLKDPDAANFVLHYDKILCPYYACKSVSIICRLFAGLLVATGAVSQWCHNLIEAYAP